MENYLKKVTRQFEAVISIHVGFKTCRQKDESYVDSNYTMTVKELEDRITSAMEIDLCDYMKKVHKKNIKIKKIHREDGSLILYFNVAIGSYYLIANYKNFIEGLILIRRHGKQIVDRVLKDCPGYLSADVNYEYPIEISDNDHDAIRQHAGVMQMTDNSYCSDLEWCSKLGRYFFQYLVISNFALICLLGILVFKALVKMYWY
jgi:hypothetical protein